MAEIKRIEVTLVQHQDDGTDRQITVATDNRDRIRWELTSARQHCPDALGDLPRMVGHEARRGHTPRLRGVLRHRSHGRGRCRQRGPYPDGDYRRLVVALALATRIPMSEWETRPYEDVLTAMEILETQQRRRR